MRALSIVIVASWLACGGQDAPRPGRPDATADTSSTDSAPNELARALLRLQAPDLGQDERREALRAFIEQLLLSQVYVPSSGPSTVSDASGASALEVFTDAASLEARHPGSAPRAVEARDMLARARDGGQGIVVRHEGEGGSVFTGFAPADAARMLEY